MASNIDQEFDCKRWERGSTRGINQKAGLAGVESSGVGHRGYSLIPVESL